jgi:hypothetical protein
VRIFYDCEFLETGRTLDLISIGMVTGDGQDTLYAVNDELLKTEPAPDSLHHRVLRHPWLMSNVVPHLPIKEAANGSGPMFAQWRPGGRAGSFTLDPESEHILPLRLIRPKVREFITRWAEVELWAWYGAFDHVVLAWLFGPMINLPDGVPMWTNDIRTLAMLAGPGARDTAPKQESQAHHALNDAHHDRDLYEHYAPLVDARRLA